MGEIVQKNMELMTPDICELKASKLFKDSEIRNLLRTRKHFEFTMNLITKRLQDFTTAIQYEKDLLLDLMKRRRAKNIPLRRQNLDFLIIKRIQNLYSTAMVHFSEDYKLHLDYYNFFRQYQTFHTAVTEHVRTMIEKFESNINVFTVAASWFYKTINREEAIKILHRGLNRHPLGLELYIDLIALELKDPNEHRLREKLRKYVDDILKNTPYHEFLIEILNMLDCYSSLMDIQNYVIENLLEKYWLEEKVWDAIALRELKGLYYQASPEEEKNKTTRKSIKRCISRYKEGIAKLPAKRQPALWKLYLNTVIDLQKENPDVANVLKTQSLKQALEEAKKHNIKLEETHWAAWIDTCGSNDDLLVQKLDEGTKEQPQSSMLWSLYLKYYILKDKAAQAEQIFSKAVKALGSRATFIWDMYIDYHLLRSPLLDVNDLYKRATSESYEEISKVFKPRYLTWSLLSSGLEECRKIYWEMADKSPYCKELHEEMIQIEQMEHYGSDLTNQLKVIGLYAKQFGHQDVDVWIQWIVINRERRSIDQNEKEREIFEQAVKALPERLAIDFKEKYKRQIIYHFSSIGIDKTRIS